MKRVRGKIIWIATVAILAAGFSLLSKMPYLVAFAIVVGAILINGWVATLEDDLPGGFNNPDGTATPGYVRYVAWGVRAVGVVALVLSAIIIGLREFGG